MSARSDHRVALITGASRGIGAAIARRLQDEGWTLSLGMRTETRPEGIDASAHVIQHDCLKADEAGWVDVVRERFGRIDVVICSAGVMTPKSVIEATDDELDRMWEVNVKSPRRLIRAAWPQLCESGRGRVVLLASLSGKRVKSETSGAYAMTKHAVMALNHGVRQAGWRHGVRATAVCPGFVATDMARAITDHPAEEMTQAEDVARLVSLALETPNEAAVAELHVNCLLEEFY
ncbi:SDR family NAD(P)-dependent oxidoreductase [Pikeienuella piscinae]|uniref:SDR family NAD(P)-dependent oxidoreductase n=1 Tax=Pikeienuella piscinae TaxID=2748098 RepID=A0A7L5BZ08_9RHOB|nr:SDR family NAD(P)-dependent oxidoreductase [Pikeienuella piscinae]QIE56068.1 SDR family NAD(P)-dependent oxidoreductase [Pikeienuella piscinae]